jgi:hypothetical protein
MKTRKKTRRHKHCFRFRIIGVDGKPQVIEAWAKVIRARSPVTLDLMADHVKRSIKLKGVGNTQTCSMAVCSLAQKDRFPHPVMGFIDWQYSRAFVVTKVGRDGLPSECVEYSHSDDIAKLNDTRGGQQKLLAGLLANGDRKISLRPTIDQTKAPGYRKNAEPKGKPDGSRTPRVHTARGGKLRFAIAQLGGFAA